MANAAALGSIRTDGHRIIEVARAAPGATVPQYPSWTLRDLVAHVAQVHGRTAEICRTLPQARIPAPEPPAARDLFDWAAATLDDMLEAFEAADPKAIVWTFVPDKRLAVWEPRMVIETGVHRWDAESAVGDPSPLPLPVAKRGLNEFTDQYLPRLGSLPTIELVDPELDRSWRYGEGEPVAVIEGTASDHYLRLMSRPGTRLPSEWETAVDVLGSPADR